MENSRALEEASERGRGFAVRRPIAGAQGGLHCVVEPRHALAEGIALEPPNAAPLSQGLTEGARRYSRASAAYHHTGQTGDTVAGPLVIALYERDALGRWNCLHTTAPGVGERAPEACLIGRTLQRLEDGAPTGPLIGDELPAALGSSPGHKNPQCASRPRDINR